MNEPAAPNRSSERTETVRSQDQFAEVRLNWWATGVFAVTAFAADFVDFMTIPAAVVAVGLFAVGTVAMAVALVIAANRSREVTIGIGGLFFLSECAPKPVQRSLMTALAVQTVVGLVSAGLRPYTSSAFGVLVPVLGLGLAGLWGARQGTFPERAVPTPGA